MDYPMAKESALSKMILSTKANGLRECRREKGRGPGQVQGLQKGLFMGFTSMEKGRLP